MSFKQTCKVAHAAKAKMLADDGDGGVGATKLMLGFGDDFLCDKVLGCTPQLLPYQVAKVVGRETQFAGTPTYGGLTFQHQLVTR